MFANFDGCFKPGIETEMGYLKNFIKLYKRSVANKGCVTCLHCVFDNDWSNYPWHCGKGREEYANGEGCCDHEPNIAMVTPFLEKLKQLETSCEVSSNEKMMKLDNTIQILENLRPGCGKKLIFTEEEICEAIDIAIEALRKGEKYE